MDTVCSLFAYQSLVVNEFLHSILISLTDITRGACSVYIIITRIYYGVCIYKVFSASFKHSRNTLHQFFVVKSVFLIYKHKVKASVL